MRRAVDLMALLTALAIAGLCYCTVFLPDFPQTVAQFLMQYAVKACCALGLASLGCLFVFVAIEFLYHRELEQQREARRQHIIRISPVQPALVIASTESAQSTTPR